jgi:hypothetical protein
MNTRLDRMIQRARAPLSALRPVLPPALPSEPAAREDTPENWDRRAESPDEQIRAPLSAPRRMDPAALHAERPPREEAQGSRDGGTASSNRRAVAGLSAPPPVVQRMDLQATAAAPADPDQTAGVQPVSVESRTADQRVPPLHIGPARPGANETRARRDDDPITVEDSPTPGSVKPRRSAAATGSAPNDLPRVEDAAAAATSMPATSMSATSMPAPQNEFNSLAVEATKADRKPRYAPAHEPPPESRDSLIEINVSIGSIDFRTARPAAAKKRYEARPRLTLESYLRRGKRDSR